MDYKQLKSEPDAVFAVVFDEGDEFTEGMLRFAEERNLTAAHFVAIGAFQQAKLGYFNLEKKDYEKQLIDEQVEVLSLTGNVADHQGKPKLHAHVVLGRRDMSTCGGHLLAGRVRPTLEVIVTESPAHLHRRHDPKTGLPLLAT